MVTNTVENTYQLYPVDKTLYWMPPDTKHGWYARATPNHTVREDFILKLKLDLHRGQQYLW